MFDYVDDQINRCRKDKNTSLDLSGCGLKAVPNEVATLTHLEELYLDHNALRELPENLGDLENLTRLSIRSNPLTALPETIGRLSQLRELDLANNLLTSLPEIFGYLASLTDLVLTSNRLTSLPYSFGNLGCLSRLDITDNQLTALPESFGNLARLTELHAGQNQLAKLPDSICGISHLAEIDLRSNPLTSLPESIGRLAHLTTIKLRPSDKLAPEIQAASRQGNNALIGLLRELSTDTISIREAKLILIGEGAAGKSSLLAALRGEQFDAERSTTHGVEVKQLVLDTPKGEAITLNAWDFGGQKAYQPTHQFFFTAPAVYIVAWNPRHSNQERMVEDWINLVRRRVGDDVRIHIVATHSDPGGQQGSLDEDRLKQLHGECVVGFHRIDSSNDRGISGLKSSLLKTAQALPHIQRRLPSRWRALLTSLNESGLSYIDYRGYLDKAAEKGLSASSADALARVATELGHWCYYPDVKGLENLVVLKGDWLSRAISFVLNDLPTKERNGLITHRRFSELWNSPHRDLNDRYPESLHDALRLLMREYQIAYQVRGDLAEPTSLISQMVPSIPPDLTEWRRFKAPHQQTYLIKFLDANRRSVIPPGLMFQLITWFHRFSLGSSDYARSLHWAHGMVIDNGHNGRALVEIDDYEQTISVTVKAHYPTYLCKLIANDVCSLVSNWRGLTASIFVPCTDQCASQDERSRGTAQFDSEMLFSLKNRGRYDVDCTACYQTISIDALVGESGIAVPQIPGSAERQLNDISLKLDDVRLTIEHEGLQTRRSIARTEERVASQIDEQTQQYLNLLADEAANGPRLITVQRAPHLPFYKRAISSGWQIVLWCEHSRLPVSVLDQDPKRGVYQFDVPKGWIQQAAPWLRFAGKIMRLSGVFAPALLKLELNPEQYKQLEDRLRLVEIASGELSRATEWFDRYDDLIDIDVAREHLKPSQFKTLHSEILKRDPGFAGLQRVRDRDQFLWVHPRFAHRYE